MKKSTIKEIQEGLLIVLVFLFVNTHLVAQSVIPSRSMVPTLQVDDRLLINKFATVYKAPERGDIVVFLKEKKFPLNEYWIKRVVALPNEVVDIKDGVVYVNGELLEEDYAIGTTYPLGGGVAYPYTVPDGHYFLMGDNREESGDSRLIGSVAEEYIEAIGAIKIWPLSDIGVLE